jgi:outer membrane immunogenic protein
MKKTIVSIAALMALAAAPAMAADMPVKAPMQPPPAPVVAWTGCYVGAGGGYGMADLRTQVINTNVVPNVAAGSVIDQGQKGWFGTVQVGCDLQVGGSWLIGAFADWDWSSIKGWHTGQDGNVGLVNGEMKLKDSWAAGGRIGYLVTPQLLTFVSAGFTEAKFNGLSYVSLFTGLPTGLAIPSQRYHGWFIGGGTEYALNWFPGLFWKTEYRFSDFKSKDLAVFSTATGVPNGFIEHTDPTVQTIRSELVYRFNWGGAPVSARY